MADISLLPTAYSSIAKVERWKKWQKQQETRLEVLLDFQKERAKQYADTLSFKGWLKSWVDPSLRIQRQAILWEMSCIDTDVVELQQQVHGHPETTIDKWRHMSLG